MATSPIISVRNSISTRLLKQVFLVYIIFAVIITAIHIFTEYRRVKGGVILELTTVHATFGKPLAIAVWEADQEQVVSLMQGLVASSLIYGVAVTETAGEYLLQAGKTINRSIWQIRADDYGSRVESDGEQSNLFGYRYPLNYSEGSSEESNTNLLGHVTLFTSEFIILNKIKYQLFYIIVTECIKAGILWLIFVWYGRRQLTKPLSELAVQASEINMENLQPIQLNVQHERRDEVVVLRDAFNTMVGNLISGVQKQNDLYSTLDKLKNNLQQEVAERTKELRSSNRDLVAQIRERKEAEDKAHRYDQILENSLNEIYVVDSIDFSFLTVNEQARQNLGYSSEDLKNLIVIDILPDYSINTFQELIQPLCNKEEDMVIFETFHRRKDSSRYSVEVHLQLMSFQEMEVLVAIILDISEKRMLEEQLRQSQKMEAIGTLAGGVAHDLNNILSGIVSYPELLLTSVPDDSPLRKPLITIQKSGQKAANIVQDLLTMARRGVPITEIVNLNQVIEEQLQSPEMEKLLSFHPNIQVVSQLDEGLLNVKGSSTHLAKTVMNLFSNAAEAMVERGLITVSTTNVYLDQVVRGYEQIAKGDYVKVTVSDDGIGIAQADIAKIFEPFYTNKSMARSGTGLGMAVVWGTVKDHDGYIDIESQEGVGTTIDLYIPVTRVELQKQPTGNYWEEYMGNGETILVVDDMKEQQEVATAMLEKLAYNVSSVSSGEEAINYVVKSPPDLLVLDMIMEPGIDGLDTYKTILEIRPNQRAVIASGFSKTERVRELQKLGAGRYIKKPYTMTSIALAVKETLGAAPRIKN